MLKIMMHVRLVFLLLCLSIKVFALDERSLSSHTASGFTKPDHGHAESASIDTRWKISPFARVGFQRMGLALVTPMPFVFSLQPANTVGGGSFAVRIPEMTLWVVEGGIEAQLVNDIRVFAIGSGNLMQRIALNMAPDLVNSITLSEWRKKDVRWITIEGGVYRQWKAPFIILGGLRWDHFLLAVREPIAPEGSSHGASVFVTPSGASLSANFIIPYAGIGLRTGPLKAQAICGVPPYSRMRLSTWFSQVVNSAQNVAGIAEVDYLGLGVLLELSGEYHSALYNKLHLTLWGRANMLGSQGRGDADIRYVSSDSATLVKPIGTDHSVRFFRHAFTGGVSIETLF